MGIYVGYESPSAIKYLEPMTKDLFTTRFSECHYDEIIFPILAGEKWVAEKENYMKCNVMFYLDPHTRQCELEVQKITHLFTDPKRITKISYISCKSSNLNWCPRRITF